MTEISKPYFAPQLFIKSGVTNIDFYTQAFGAVELRRFSNDDGSIHVSELSIDFMKKPPAPTRSAPKNITAQPLPSAYSFMM
jgi:hypothetical protein